MERDHQVLIEREEKALEELHKAKHEYETALTNSLRDGKDETDKLDHLDEKINEAKAKYERRQRERMVHSSIYKPGISADDVVAAFNTEFYPKFNEKVAQPALDKLLAMKEAYFVAVSEYEATVRQFNAEKNYAISELAPKHQYQLKAIELPNINEVEKYYIQKSEVR
ncbi:hypothetical protein QUF84_21020 [Fictibacillus enclensis]|uniref:hypothetical protein n=1 Tax=Fictibacillus enclensis TaxID=1017270 RepID=UPI0025A1F6C7|nr:hypothetical protein [Fictibacillus enclensis]MDM5339685.1 hypothetical protein [Fictibacillus enclensis]